MIEPEIEKDLPRAVYRVVVSGFHPKQYDKPRNTSFFTQEAAEKFADKVRSKGGNARIFWSPCRQWNEIPQSRPAS